MNKATTFFIFLATNIATGYGVYRYTKYKIEKRTEEEIEEVRTYYREKVDKLRGEQESKEEPKAEENTKPQEPTEEEHAEYQNLADDYSPEANEHYRMDYKKRAIMQKLRNTEYITDDTRQDWNGRTRYINEELYKKKSGPYVLHPDEFGDGDYGIVTYDYYADGTLVDERGDILSDAEIEEYFGWDILKTFGDYVEDATYVRNDELRTDYEILFINYPYEE